MFSMFGQICGILELYKVPVSTLSEVPVWQIRMKGVPMKKALKTSAEGRRCEYPDCQQVLSIYNHQTYCRVHQEKVFSRERYKHYKHFAK